MATEARAMSWLPAIWDAPASIKAGTTTRKGGSSLPPYDSLNLGLHVGDDVESVNRNRSYLADLLRLDSEPVWLEQVHGKRILTNNNHDNKIADGIYSELAGVVCVVMTADCVPLLLCNTRGNRIAAVHAGWRGICAGVVEAALTQFGTDELIAWIGPHIRADNYEVGDDVRDACINKHGQFSKAFRRNERGRWQADIEQMIGQILTNRGVNRIFSSGLCTYTRADIFYSYRRDQQTGRTASMIWIDK